ncbi:acyl carrier protein [Pantoea sp. Mb-10]|uniref:acyl carrier protein n=1 Tax=unclassified Pantoea TaxID=2630326 RepID=UPI001E4A83BF|nr:MULTISPECIES: acyl carrier protein [unclassified Pantoea]MCE0489025.1 acyl carrier protein [Pantoea sp. Mb-10]MCE0503619.1 acyl carrier protein [Pantoea sp. Pb-8]
MKDTIHRIITECTFSYPLTEEVSLIYDLYMDSMMFTEMVIALEQAFAIEISDAETQNLFLVRDVYRLVEKKRGAVSP